MDRSHRSHSAATAMGRHIRALRALAKAERSGANLMPAILAAVAAKATLGEISGVLREAWGEHRDRPVL
jgi:methylmalonyl-CoA mutase N-terminal domain/subunit